MLCPSTRYARSGHSTTVIHNTTVVEWSGQWDLNPRPLAPHASALPSCAMARLSWSKIMSGYKPTAPRLPLDGFDGFDGFDRLTVVSPSNHRLTVVSSIEPQAHRGESIEPQARGRSGYSTTVINNTTVVEWSGQWDLNPRPLRPERSALPSCAMARCGRILLDFGIIVYRDLCKSY